jgi:hypothetical protein
MVYATTSEQLRVATDREVALMLIESCASDDPRLGALLDAAASRLLRAGGGAVPTEHLMRYLEDLTDMQTAQQQSEDNDTTETT